MPQPPRLPRPTGELPPVQLCRHCESPLLQVSVPDGPQPVRLHAETLQGRCAPPLRTSAYPAPMALVDGEWMTERMARELRGLPVEPAPVTAAAPDLQITLPLPLQLPLALPRGVAGRRDVAAAG